VNRSIPDPLSHDDDLKLLHALLVGREHPVPRDVLEAEFEHVAEWARGVMLEWAMLEMLLRGLAAVSIVEGDLAFHRTVET
jgi:hypothetical protein